MLLAATLVVQPVVKPVVQPVGWTMQMSPAKWTVDDVARLIEIKKELCFIY